MACHLTTADFINQQADGPFLDATWKCRVPGCGKVPGEHPAPIVQPGNYLILCISLVYIYLYRTAISWICTHTLEEQLFWSKERNL